MKITEKELRDLVNEAISTKLTENRDFTAKRQIVQAAQTASMSFENEISTLLDLVPPDDLNPVLQKAYFEIVEQMKLEIVHSVSEAVTKLSRLPRNKAE